MSTHLAHSTLPWFFKDVVHHHMQRQVTQAVFSIRPLLLCRHHGAAAVVLQLVGRHQQQWHPPHVVVISQPVSSAALYYNVWCLDVIARRGSGAVVWEERGKRVKQGGGRGSLADEGELSNTLTTHSLLFHLLEAPSPSGP